MRNHDQVCITHSIEVGDFLYTIRGQGQLPAENKNTSELHVPPINITQYIVLCSDLCSRLLFE